MIDSEQEEQDQDESNILYRKITQICYAISEDNERAVSKILKNGYDINARIAADNPFKAFTPNMAGMNALHFACNNPSMRSLNVLLDNNADFTMKNLCGSTALHSLVENKCAPLSKVMDYVSDDSNCVAPHILSAHVKNGNSINPTNNHGLSHFHIACLVSHVEAVKLFLESGVQVNDPILNSSPVLPGYTALHIAVRYGSLEVVQLLMSYKADVHARNQDGVIPLQLLCTRLEEISYLALHRENYQKHQELHIRFQNDTYEIASILIQRTFKLDTLVDELCIVCAKKCSAHVKEILDKGVDINARASFGFTALHCAALVDFDVTKLLLERGADIFLQNDGGITPLDICTWKYGYDIFQLLPLDQRLGKYIIQEGQSWRIALSFQNEKTLKDLLSDENIAPEINTACIARESLLWPGATPLHLAVIFARNNPRQRVSVNDSCLSYNPQCAQDLLQILISHGASVTKRDAKGRTPIHSAFYYQKFGILEMLMNPYQRPPQIRHLTSFENPVDEFGLSHFHIACTTGCKHSIGVILCDNAASINEPIKSDVTANSGHGRPDTLLKAGSTPLHIAARLKEIEAIEVLVVYHADISVKDSDGLTPIDIIASNPDFDESELVDLALFLIQVCCKSNPETPSAEVGRFQTLCAVLDPIVLNARHGYCRRLYNSMLSQRPQYKNAEKLISCLEKVREFMIKGSDSNAMMSGYMQCLKKILKKNDEYKVSVGSCFRGYALSVLDMYHVLRSRKLMEDGTQDASLEISIRECLSNYGESLISQHRSRSSRILDDDSQMTHLHLACAIDMLMMAELLIKVGSDINQRLSPNSPFFPGSTPLHLLIRCCEEKISEDDAKNIEKLITEHGADPNIADTNGETSLHLAMRYSGDQNSKTDAEVIVKVVKVMLEHGADPTVQNVNGETSLHLADRFCCKIINLLLLDERVPKSNPISKFGRSHFHIACRSNLPEVVEKFLQYGADPNELNHAIDNNVWRAVNSDEYNPFFVNFTPLQNASDLDVIKVLLKYGADPKVEDYRGWTALHRAAVSDCGADVITALIREGGADVNSRSVLHLTPLDLTVTNFIDNDDDACRIRTLLEHGALVNRENFEDSSTLARAFQSCDIELLQTLLEYGKDVSDLNEHKRTAMHELFFGYQLEDPDEYIIMIEQLCRRGVDIDCQDSLGQTPLHIAAQKGLEHGTTALLACGANINMTDNEGRTPLSLLADDSTDMDGCQIPLYHKKTICPIFFKHVQKMQQFNILVSQKNMILEKGYSPEIGNTESSQKSPNNESDKPQQYHGELDQMKDTILEDNVTLRDAVYMDSHKLTALIENDALNSILESQDFHEKFPHLGGILKLKYRIAHRKKAIKLASTLLYLIFGRKIPETCTEIIASCLSNRDLKNLAGMMLQ